MGAILSLYTRRHHTTRHKMPKGSGLTKPLALSPELADIVGAKKGEQLSRPEVVKRIWAYLKEKKLQDPENKQYFVPDKKMEPVFGKDKTEDEWRCSRPTNISTTNTSAAPTPATLIQYKSQIFAPSIKHVSRPINWKPTSE